MLTRKRQKRIFGDADAEGALQRPKFDDCNLTKVVAPDDGNHIWSTKNGEAVVAVIRHAVDLEATLQLVEEYVDACKQANLPSFSVQRTGHRGVQSMLFGSWVAMRTEIKPISGSDRPPYRSFSAALQPVAAKVSSLLKGTMPAAYQAMAPIENSSDILAKDRCVHTAILASSLLTTLALLLDLACSVV